MACIPTAVGGAVCLLGGRQQRTALQQGRCLGLCGMAVAFSGQLVVEGLQSEAMASCPDSDVWQRVHMG